MGELRGKNLCENKGPNESLSPCVTMFLKICGPLQNLKKPLWNKDMALEKVWPKIPESC